MARNGATLEIDRRHAAADERKLVAANEYHFLRHRIRRQRDAEGLRCRFNRVLQAAVLDADRGDIAQIGRSEEHTSELQSLMRISYAVFCLKKKKYKNTKAKNKQSKDATT